MWTVIHLNMGRNMHTKKKTPAMAKQCLGRFLMPAVHTHTLDIVPEAISFSE